MLKYASKAMIPTQITVHSPATVAEKGLRYWDAAFPRYSNIPSPTSSTTACSAREGLRTCHKFFRITSRKYAIEQVVVVVVVVNTGRMMYAQTAFAAYKAQTKAP